MRLSDLYAEYGDRVQFLVIYIREAHPTDGWYMGNHDFRDPRTIGERRELAETCEIRLRYGIPTIVDEMDDRVMKAYAAWPDRLYLVDFDGTVTYAGGIGPWGFNPSELKRAIDRLMDSDARYEAA